MKKNVMMRVASILLVLVLMSTSAISGTFAKYVTKSSGNDEARVAYWGFDAPADLAIDMFDDVYTSAAGTTVDSENGDNVVAPGTEKSTTFGFGYTPKGATVNALTAGAIEAPEVMYDFKVDVAMTGDYDQLDANPNFYWTLGANEYQTVAELLAAVKLLSGDASGTKRYNPGELPAAFTAADETYTIGWVWEFETADDPATPENEMDIQDAFDTAMGNAQDLDDVTFTITISATQVD